MARKHYIEILNELKSIKGIKEKQELLERERDNVELQRYFKYALDPMITFGIKQIPKYQTPARPSFNFGNIYKQLNKLVNRELTGNAAIAFLRNIFESISADEAAVLETIIKKKPDCGVSVKTVNKVWENLVMDYPVMLCSPASDELIKKMPWPLYGQIKYDGARANIIVQPKKIEIRSRSGKEITLPTNDIEQDIRKIFSNTGQFVLDGELLVVDEYNNIMPRKTGNGILNKAIRGKIKENEAQRVIFVAWDVIPYDSWKERKTVNVPYHTRLTELMKFFSVRAEHPQHLRIIENRILKSFNEAEEFFEEAVDSGQEGIILKNPNGPWEPKRVNHQLKMKVEKTADLTVQSIVEGVGKYAKMLGSFLCTDASGELKVHVGSGFTDEQRKEYFSDSMLGKIVEVKYNEVIEDSAGNKSLFLPVLIQVREDKSEPNDLSEL